jgi:benzylsuccinate CoA-transferase BbsF subunit
LAGRLLADLGATVFRVEPPGGDADRFTGALARGGGKRPNPEWHAFNRGKLSVTADIRRPAGRGLILDLLRRCDVVIESFTPGDLEGLGLGYDELAAANPAVVLTRISPFGQSGPYARFAATDLIVAAMGGAVWVNGDPDRPPVRISADQYFAHAAAEAALHTIAAGYHAARTGQGQCIDVSAQLATMRTLHNALAGPATDGTVVDRASYGQPSPRMPYQQLFQCADGYVAALLWFGPMSYLDWLRDAGSLPAELAEITAEQVESPTLLADLPWFASSVNSALSLFIRLRGKRELAADALARRIILAPVSNVADLSQDAQLTARGYFTDVDYAGIGRLRTAHNWAKLGRTPLVAPRGTAAPGAHNDAVRGSQPRRPRAGRAQTDGVGLAPRVFDGLKVWDASWVGVGPLTARYLADHGATVVRSESSKNLDVLRGGPPFRDGVRGINRSQFFAEFNASKLGLGVNLTSEGGRKVGLRLARWADVIIESFRPGTFDRMGYAYERLSESNLGLIMLSTSLSGRTGPRKDFAGFGSVLAPMSGFSDLTGWPDRTPGAPYGAYTDFIAQRFAAASVMAALEHRRLSGRGQHIDLAQMEAALQFLGPQLLDYQMSGCIATRDGNRSATAAPHGVFPCLPQDDRECWVAIAVETDGQWEALAMALGAPGLAADPRLATLAGRKEHEPFLEKAISEWTMSRTAQEVMESLQPKVPAGYVHDARALHADPQVAHRGYFRTLRHTVMGDAVYEGSQVGMSRTPPGPTKAAPCLGEDTRHVLTGLLHYSAAEVEALLAAGDAEINLD